jgi:hypothetical protein
MKKKKTPLSKRSIVWRSSDVGLNQAGTPRELNPVGRGKFHQESRAVRRLKARQLSRLERKSTPETK